MSRSSQTDARNNHRQTSACHHIHNPAEPPPATPTTRQTVKPRVPRHTQHDTSTDNPPASHHNHPHPNVTTYTTQHIAHPSTPTNEPTAPTHAPACTTRQTSAGSDNSLSRAALHPPNSVHHTAPQPPPTTTNHHQSTPIGNGRQRRSDQSAASTDIDDHCFRRFLVEHFAIHIATHIHAARRGFVLVLPWTYQVHVPYLNVIGSVVSQILKIEGLI